VTWMAPRSPRSATPAGRTTFGAAFLYGAQPEGNPYNSGLIIDDAASCVLLPQAAPWTPVEPWEPGDLGIPYVRTKCSKSP